MSDTQAPFPQPGGDAPRPRPNPFDAPPPFPDAGAPGYQQPYPAWQQPGPYGSPVNPYSGGHRPVASGDERLWAMLAHLSAVVAWIISAGWLNVVGPLVVWLLQKDRSRFVRNASAGAFNFTLTMWVLGVVGWVLTFTVIGAVIGIPLIIISGLGAIILGLVGAVKAWNGESYTYPWQLPVLS